MAELADAPDLGSGVYVRGGSSPFTRTNKKKALAFASAFFCYIRLMASDIALQQQYNRLGRVIITTRV